MLASSLGRWFLGSAVALVAIPLQAQEEGKPKAVPALRIQEAGAAATAAPAQAAKKADIYDPKADAAELVAKAVAKAKRDNSRVMLMFGGNWCGWCHKLHATLKSDRDLAKLMLDEYVLTMVDTAAPNAEKVMADLQVDTKAGVPYLIFLDGDGKVVARQDTGSLEEGDHHDPKKVAAVLKANAAPAQDAQALFDAAMKQAATEDKQVFLHFGAPWCGWCHKLEDFLARDDMAKLFAKEFVDRKIDVDRTTGGKDLQAKFGADEKGIPWFAFLDRDGRVVADSDAPKSGNIGYPAAPEEIAHFVAMLKKSARHLNAEEIATIEKELTKAGEAINSARGR